MSVSNCNCGEKMECGCALSLNAYLSPAVSVLDVGTLVATGCVISGYVIDWYRNGEWYMASASADGMETDISAIHPFTGSSAIPVISGIYTPVVRYVVIAGVKVFASKRACRIWCDMTISLPEITVTALSCASTSVSPQYSYQYTLKYLSSMDYSLASRLVRIELDANVVQFAWYFTAKTVADRMQIYHSRTGEMLADWVVGNEVTYRDFTGSPHVLGNFIYQRGCFDVPPYQPGDALIVRITPNYLGSSFNTEWEFSYKCLTTALIPPVISKELRAYDIDTVDFSWDAANCFFLFKIKFAALFPSVNGDFNRYTGVGTTSYGYYRSFGDGWYGIAAYYVTNASLSSTYDATKKSLGAQWVSVTKTGSLFVFAFSDDADYQVAKTNYNALLTSAPYTGWVNDPTDVRYYRLIGIRWGQTTTTCGDNEVYSIYYFFIRCNVVFDDGSKTLAIDSVPVTNGLPDSADPCNRAKSHVDTYVYYMNQTNALADFTLISRCLYTGLFKNIYYFTGIPLPSLSFQAAGYGYGAYGIDTDPDGVVNTSTGWCYPIGQVSSYYRPEMIIYFWWLVITAQRDAAGNWLTDPLQNFYVSEDHFLPETNCRSGSRKIYEKVNGVVTVKRYYDGN